MSKQDAPKARLSYRYSETLPPLTRGLWCLGTMLPPWRMSVSVSSRAHRREAHPRGRYRAENNRAHFES